MSKSTKITLSVICIALIAAVAVIASNCSRQMEEQRILQMEIDTIYQEANNHLNAGKASLSEGDFIKAYEYLALAEGAATVQREEAIEVPLPTSEEAGQLIDLLPQSAVEMAKTCILNNDARGACLYLLKADEIHNELKYRATVDESQLDEDSINSILNQIARIGLPSHYLSTDGDAEGAAAIFSWRQQQLEVYLSRTNSFVPPFEKISLHAQSESWYEEIWFTVRSAVGKQFEDAGNLAGAYLWYKEALEYGFSEEITGERLQILNGTDADLLKWRQELQAHIDALEARIYSETRDIPLCLWHSDRYYPWRNGYSRPELLDSDIFEDMWQCLEDYLFADRTLKFCEIEQFKTISDVKQANKRMSMHLDSYYNDRITFTINKEFAAISFIRVNTIYDDSEFYDPIDYVKITADNERLQPVSQDGNRYRYDVSGVDAISIESNHPGNFGAPFSGVIYLEDFYFHK